MLAHNALTALTTLDFKYILENAKIKINYVY